MSLYIYLIVYFNFLSVKFQRLLQDVRLKALRLVIIAFKCILNVHWLIALVHKVLNFEIRSFFHFPTPKKPLRTNFLPSLKSAFWAVKADRFQELEKFKLSGCQRFRTIQSIFCFCLFWSFFRNHKISILY